MPAKAPRKPRAAASSSSKPAAKRSRAARTTTSSAASATPAPASSREATPEPQAYNALQKTIATVFAQAQKTTAGHRKLAINLRTVLDQCLTGTGSIGSTLGPGISARDGEKIFTKEFCGFLNRVLVVKKSEVVGDRCLRFADLFLRNLYGKEKRDKEKDKMKKAKQLQKEQKQKQKQEQADGDSDVEMQDADAVGEEQEEEEEDDEEEEPFEETSAIRVILRVINHLSPLIASKEKVVRYRTTQFIALILTNTLSTFPFDYSKRALLIIQKVASALAKRLQDKEAMVRVQAAVGLIRLLEMGVSTDSDNEDDDDEDEGHNNDGVLGALIEAMQNDPSSDVRRTILYNLSPVPNTLPYLLERSRDVDAATRRSVYTRLLPSLGDFRHLTIGMREKLIRWGLNDRDDTVRQAAKKMFNFRWVEDAGGDLLEVLERLDVTSEGIDGGPLDLALKGFWEQRKDVVEQLVFDDEYWENLTPEATFLVRSYNDYCRNSIAAGVDVDEKMPEVTKLAFFLQQYMNKLVAALRANDTTESEYFEFIVQQLLLIANTMDFGDEIGRRKMFALLRESLSIVELSEAITRLVVEGLGKLCMGENDFCELMLTTIAEIHDLVRDEEDEEQAAREDSFETAKSGPDDDEGHQTDESVGETIRVQSRKGADGKKSESHRPHKKRRTSEEPGSIATLKQKSTPVTKKAPTTAAPEDSKSRRRPQDEDSMDVDSGDNEEDEEEKAAEAEAARALLELTVNLKCLHIAQSLLELITPTPGTLPTPLMMMLNSLIVPAVRTHEAPVRERGLRCLGLFTLLDRKLAEDNLPVFAHCFNHGHESLQKEALHIISDILMVHGASILDSESSKYEQRTLFRMLAKAIKSEDIEEIVQSTAAEVVCKLMLARIIKDEDLLKVLVIAYFDPATAGNQTIRQTLSYFLPVYCHSAAENAELMAQVAVSVVHTLLTLRLDAEEPEEMVPMSSVAAHLADWTDPRKTVAPTATKLTEKVVAPSTHAILAASCLQRLLTPSCSKEERKVVVSLLGKCWIPREADKDVLREVHEAAMQAIQGKVVTDVAGKNTLAKVEATVGAWVAEIEAEEVGEGTVLPAKADGDEEEEEDDEDGEGEGEAEGAAVPAEDTLLPPDEDEGMETDRTPAVTDADDSDA